jgi:hypothetical protein
MELALANHRDLVGHVRPAGQQPVASRERMIFMALLSKNFLFSIQLFQRSRIKNMRLVALSPVCKFFPSD